MIQVRDVPDRVHGTLKSRAGRESMSLSDFIERELERVAERPTMLEWLERTAQAKPIPSKKSAPKSSANCAMNDANSALGRFPVSVFWIEESAQNAQDRDRRIHRLDVMRTHRVRPRRSTRQASWSAARAFCLAPLPCWESRDWNRTTPATRLSELAMVKKRGTPATSAPSRSYPRYTE